MRRALLLLLILGCAPEGQLRQDAATLADPIYDGRKTGTNGAFAAASWIAGRMRDEGLSVEFQPFTHKELACKNVVAMIPGRRADRVIVVGAHYDHLGSAVEHGTHTLYPGADDNASGTAGLLDLARRLRGWKPENTVVLVAFSGEEIGLIGSSHFVRNAKTRVISMVNMDMIGRLGGGKLIIGGVETGTGFRAIVEKAADIPVVLKEGGEGPSDFAAFFREGVPVLWFFSGAHADHHKPTDTIDKLDAGGMDRIVGVVERVVRAIDALPEPPEFHRVAGKEPVASEPHPGRTMVLLGTMPDYAFEGKGVRLSGVREEGAAAAAGLMAGDVIIELAGTPVEDVEGYTEILYELETNKPYRFKAMRDAQVIEGTVTPTRRWGEH